MENKHDSVLLKEAIEQLDLRSNDVVVDATLGGAGHFSAILEALDGEGTLIGIDADRDAVARANAAVARTHTDATVHVVENNFRNLSTILEEKKVPKITKALFDLGWSSFHLESGRGFSFKAHEPLYMTYGEPEQGKTAADLINSAPEELLAEILFTYGEERFGRNIARAIVQARKLAPILTTDDLVRVVESGTPSWYHHRKLHPATKTFQALRIAVNDEFGALRDGLSAALQALEEGGRIAVITFHSSEDRIVKNMLRDAAYEGRGHVVTRKPIVPSAAELARNPRARSAKLRVFERLTTVGKVDIPIHNIRADAPVRERTLTHSSPTYDYVA